MTEPISLRRTILGGLAVLIAAGIARMVAMFATASIAGADVESTDPAVRRDGLLMGAGNLGGALAGSAVLALDARPEPPRILPLGRPRARALILALLAGGARLALIDRVALIAGR